MSKLKVRIQYEYPLRKPNILFQSELIKVNQAILIADEIERKLKVKVTFTDEYDSICLKKDLIKYLQKTIEEPSDIVVYFDGGYDKNSKITGIGICIYYIQNGNTFRIRKNRLLEGLENNNESEYAALEFVVNELAWMDVKNKEVIFRGDSQVVIQQMLGEWAVYEKRFLNYINRIERELLKLRISPVYENINRKENVESHKLATQAINGIEINSKIIIDGDS